MLALVYDNRTIADSHLNSTQVLEAEKHKDIRTGGAAQMKMQGFMLNLVEGHTLPALLRHQLPMGKERVHLTPGNSYFLLRQHFMDLAKVTKLASIWAHSSAAKLTSRRTVSQF